MAMRKLVHFGAGGPDETEDTFLRLPEAKRDAKIQDARRTKEWLTARGREEADD